MYDIERATELVNEVISKEQDLLFKLTDTDWELANAVRKWNDNLKMIREVLVDAEWNKFSNSSVEIWLQDLNVVLYVMEGVLELLAIQVYENEVKTMDQRIHRIKMENETTLLASNDGLQEKVADITQRLEGIPKQTTSLQFLALDDKQQQTFQTEALKSQRETSFMVSKSKVFGRDDMKQEIMTRLLQENRDDGSFQRYVMIPIVGMGGIGKTTLARLVYDDEHLKGYFDLMAWVSVSEVFDVKGITTSIIKEFESKATAVEFSNLNQAHNRLKQLLMGNRFLIVLDDIWNENYQNWDNLQKPFQYAAERSRVIMTTRNESIAKLMNTNSEHDNIIYLKGLSVDACWNIVQHHAGNKTDLEEMQADIISKCKELPLAAKVLGDILKSRDTRACQQISSKDIWSEILQVLRPSYLNLPSHLKRIFAYCSVFPKSYIFKMEEFVLLCMAQGFLTENRSDSIETIGQDYLCELVSRSLLEVDPSHEKEFIMHDLIHDLALEVAGDICHVMNSEDIMEVNKNSTCHVCLIEDAVPTLGNLLPIASQLQTLYCFHTNADVNLIGRFSSIRAISLVSDEVKELPEGIGDLKEMRFLKLECPCIEELPKSINNLRNLQTLWLGCSLNKMSGPNLSLPSSLLYLKIIGFQSLKSIDCSSLPNLIALSIEHCPQLESLGDNALPLPSSLSKIFISGNGNLRNLSVTYCTNLTSLRVEDCPNLEALVGKFTSLIDLKLTDCPKLHSFPQFIQMSTLEDLILEDVGSSTDGVESIPGPHLELRSSLCELRIGGFQNLKSIKCSAFPNLASLNIRDCPKFEMFVDNALPPQLKEVRIEGCDHELIKPHLKSDPHGPIRLLSGFLSDGYSLA